jgi:hypothetical protein
VAKTLQLQQRSTAFVRKRIVGSVVKRRTIKGDDDQDVTEIRVPVSSTAIDRDGDQFTLDGLKAMKKKLDTGDVPIFLDHGRDEWGMPMYSVLDIIGGWKSGEIEDETLYAVGQLDPNDERAQRLDGKIRVGLPIGWSVGFMPTRASPKLDDAAEEIGGLDYSDVDLYEISAVGIPSNPDGVTEALTLLSKNTGIAESELRKRFIRLLHDAVQEDIDMKLTEKELEQIEAQRKAGLDGAAVKPEQELKSPPAVLTADDLKTALLASQETLLKKLVAALKKAEEDEDEEKEDEEEEEEEEEEKEDEEEDEDEPKGGKGKKPRARGIVSVAQPQIPSGKGHEGDEAPVIAPYAKAAT